MHYVCSEGRKAKAQVQPAPVPSEAPVPGLSRSIQWLLAIWGFPHIPPSPPSSLRVLPVHGSVPKPPHFIRTPAAWDQGVPQASF